MTHLTCVVCDERSTSSRWRIVGLWMTAMLALPVALTAAPPAPSDATPADRVDAPALDPAAEIPGEPSADGAQVLTRGPVHEAFAEAVALDPQAGVVVTKAPPAAIEELPPDQKPEGDNVQWIPGYWAWDDERDDFLWVSGVWRQLPPARQWVGGYWRQVDGGYQWVSGYWGDAKTQEVEYIPQAPPATLEAGPSVAAASPDQSWIPGNWVWQQSRYAWQPGYWTAPQANWVWVPSHYVWAPGGFIFTSGYWDYEPINRGVLFAPVYFAGGAYSRPGFFYSPATVISLAIFGNQLFCRPNYHHYYFGDYYAPNYLGAGFYPWFAMNKHQGYDPIWAQQQWKHRNDHDFARHVEANYQLRRDDQNARPPRTFEAQKTLAAKGGGDKNRFVPIATPLDQVVKSKDAPHRFKQLDKQERQQLATREKEMQNFRQERQKLEATVKDTGGKQPTKLAMPKAPIAPMSDANKRVSGSQKSTGATRIERDRRLQSGIGAAGNPSGDNKTTTVAPGKLKDTPRVVPTNPQDPQLRTRRGLADQSRSGGERAKVQNPVQNLSPSPKTTQNLNPSQPRTRIEAAKPPINNRTFQNQPGGRVIPNSPLDAQQKQQGDSRRERSTQKPATGPFQQQPQSQQQFKQQQQFQQQKPQLRQQNEQPSQRQFNAQGQQGSNFRSNQPSGQPQGQPSQPQKNDKRGRDKDKDR